MAYPDPSKPYKLYTDSSNYTIAACLTQECEEDKDFPVRGFSKERPIYFLSHKLSKTQQRYSVIEKEAYAVVYALQKLHHFLHNSKFTIYTDHAPLQYLLKGDIRNKRIQQWALAIAGYDCEIQYIKGSMNNVADFLSSTPVQVGAENQSLTENASGNEEPQIDDRYLEVNVINSDKIDPKAFVASKLPDVDLLDEPLPKLGHFDMSVEQNKDKSIVEIKKHLEENTGTSTIHNNYIHLDNTVYYLSNADADPVLRLYIPSHLRKYVIRQYHDLNGHIGTERCFYTIKSKYFWPNLFKDLHAYINNCIPCQTRNARQIRAPLQETDIPPFPFSRVSLDVSGPYPESLSGNKYVVTFICMYFGYIECFPTPEKSSSVIAHLIVEEIIPRYECCLEVLHDNGLENIAKQVQDLLSYMKINSVKTSYYSPRSNGLCEKSHSTLLSVIGKLMNENSSWELLIPQALASVRFAVNLSTGYSPYFLLFGRDVIFPLDTVLQPRRKYQGEDPIHSILQLQHQAFTHVHRNLQKARKRQKRYADKNAQRVEFKVGSPVYYKNFRRTAKFAPKFLPYYRIIEQKGPVTFIIKSQLDGTTTKATADQLRLANLDWGVLRKGNIYNPTGRPLRKAQLAMPPEQSLSDSETSDSERELQRGKGKFTRRYRMMRSSSDDEENIPLYELKQRLQARKERNESLNKLESDQSMDESENQYFTSEEQDDMKMDIDLVDRQTKNSGLNLVEKGDQKKESVGSEISPMEKEIDLK